MAFVIHTCTSCDVSRILLHNSHHVTRAWIMYCGVDGQIGRLASSRKVRLFLEPPKGPKHQQYAA